MMTKGFHFTQFCPTFSSNISKFYEKKYLKNKFETAEILFLCFYYYHWVDTTADGLLVLEGIIHPVVGVSITGWIPLLVDY